MILAGLARNGQAWARGRVTLDHENHRRRLGKAKRAQLAQIKLLGTLCFAQPTGYFTAGYFTLWRTVCLLDARFSHQPLHFPYCVFPADEDGLRDDGMADVEFFHAGQGGDGLHVVIMQAVAGVDCEAE